MAMSQVSAVRQAHPKQRVPRLQDGEIHRHVRLGPGVRLDIGMLRREEQLRALDRKRLHRIRVRTSAVIALPRVAFGILVREHRTHGLKYRLADKVLGGDQIDVFGLTRDLVINRARDLRIHVGKQRCHVLGCLHHGRSGEKEARRFLPSWPPFHSIRERAREPRQPACCRATNCADALDVADPSSFIREIRVAEWPSSGAGASYYIPREGSRQRRRQGLHISLASGCVCSRWNRQSPASRHEKRGLPPISFSQTSDRRVRSRLWILYLTTTH